MKVLNVAEKPSVAKEIANILSAGRSQRVRVCAPSLGSARAAGECSRRLVGRAAWAGAAAPGLLQVQRRVRVPVRDPGPARADGRHVGHGPPHGARL